MKRLRKLGRELADAWRWYRSLPHGRRGKPVVGPASGPALAPRSMPIAWTWAEIDRGDDGFTTPNVFRREYLSRWTPNEADYRELDPWHEDPS